MKNLITVITTYPKNLAFGNKTESYTTDQAETHTLSDEFFFELLEALKKPALAVPVKIECRVSHPDGKEVLFTIDRLEV